VTVAAVAGSRYPCRVRIYHSFGPNPRALRMVLAEKGLELPAVDLDILGAENRQPAYLAKNPGGQIPALELDDGRVIGETVAIFEYLEERHPTPPLVGTTPEERAETRMWQRRVELKITEHLYNGFRFGEGLELFRPRMRVLPEASAGLKATAQDGLAWLDPLLADKQWIAGDCFTLADVMLYCALDFGRSVGQPLDRSRHNVSAWFDRVAARPSARRSLHPQAEAIGMNG
jgi:glutathione S-transferase